MKHSPFILLLVFATVGSAKELKRPYSVKHKAPLNAKISIKQRSNEFTTWRVEFDGIEGDRVPGFLYAPTSKTKKRPAVLMQYGTGGRKTSSYIVAFGKQFAAAGFVVLTIDSPQRGERRKKGYRDNLIRQMHPKKFAQYCGDYSRAVDYLVSRSDVDVNRIGYVGISWGAITGVTFCAHDKRIKSVASIVGGGSFGTLLGHGGRVLSKYPSMDPVDHVAHIAPRPLLLINVTNDWVVPRVFATALHKAAGKGKKIVWLKTNHKFTTVNRRAMMGSVIKFMDSGLREPVRESRRKQP